MAGLDLGGGARAPLGALRPPGAFRVENRWDGGWALDGEESEGAAGAAGAGWGAAGALELRVHLRKAVALAGRVPPGARAHARLAVMEVTPGYDAGGRDAPVLVHRGSSPGARARAEGGGRPQTDGSGGRWTR